MDLAALDSEDDDVAAMSLAEASAALRSVQEGESRLAARKAALCARVHRARLHRSDGHRSAYAWLKAEQNCSAASAGREIQRATMLAALPAVSAELRAGRLGVDQVDLIARMYANPRARADLMRVVDVLIGLARSLPYLDLGVAADRFMAHADPDGNDQSHDNARDGRRARASFVGTSFVFTAEGDTLSGTELAAILAVFEQTEFEQDWAAAKAVHGDATSAADMARTAVQRRYDALLAMARAAASAGVVVLPDVLVNLVIDAATAAAAVQRVTGDAVSSPVPGTPAPDPVYRRSGDPADPATWFWRRSETISGIPIDPRAIITAAIAGHIRRVITDPHTGVTVNLGHKQRLFRNGARDAVLLTWLHCFGPGCDIANVHCEIDHIIPHHRQGPTDTDNGIPGCDHHNRDKDRHRRTTRVDHNGNVHVHRPDGTEVAPTARGKPPP